MIDAYDFGRIVIDVTTFTTAVIILTVLIAERA